MSAKCDRNCFNCKFPDCIDGNSPYPESSEIYFMVYKQDRELQIKRAVYMHGKGYMINEIAAALHVSEEYAASLLGTYRHMEKVHYARKDKNEYCRPDDREKVWKACC